MITVHHLENSRSQRVLWMLEELGLDYEVKLYKREPTMQAPESLRAVHPLGKSPVITDGDKMLAESGAILEYLVETYGNGRFAPKHGTPERLHYTYFLHYAEGSLMPLLFMKLVFNRLPERVPWAMRPVAKMISNGADKALLGPQITNHFAFLESELHKREWFTGAELTAADYNPVTYLLAGMRSLNEGWDWSELAGSLIAVAGLGIISMSMCFAALRGRIARG